MQLQYPRAHFERTHRQRAIACSVKVQYTAAAITRVTQAVAVDKTRDGVEPIFYLPGPVIVAVVVYYNQIVILLCDVRYIVPTSVLCAFNFFLFYSLYTNRVKKTLSYSRPSVST